MLPRHLKRSFQKTPSPVHVATFNDDIFEQWHRTRIYTEWKASWGTELLQLLATLALLHQDGLKNIV